ncbi:MAG TPA: hypothetical protein VJ822_01280 [Dongiaceae bacterium]|nr:hypothetical protein [Dongiaceae bacterium]
MNLDEVAFDDVEENGKYTSKRGSISAQIAPRTRSAITIASRLEPADAARRLSGP